MAPSYDLISKPTTTVDVNRLQSELRALHSRLALLEKVTIEQALKADEPTDVDESLGPSEQATAVSIEAPPSPVEEENNDLIPPPCDKEPINTEDVLQQGDDTSRYCFQCFGYGGLFPLFSVVGFESSIPSQFAAMQCDYPAHAVVLANTSTQQSKFCIEIESILAYSTAY